MTIQNRIYQSMIRGINEANPYKPGEPQSWDSENYEDYYKPWNPGHPSKPNPYYDPDALSPWDESPWTPGPPPPDAEETPGYEEDVPDDDGGIDPIQPMPVLAPPSYKPKPYAPTNPTDLSRPYQPGYDEPADGGQGGGQGGGMTPPMGIPGRIPRIPGLPGWAQPILQRIGK